MRARISATVSPPICGIAQGDHLGNTRRDAIFLVWIDDPAIDAMLDLVASKPGGAGFVVMAFPSSSGAGRAMVIPEAPRC
jgi:hypothetical protein